MQFELAHSLPGRVRLRLPSLQGRPREFRLVEEALAGMPGLGSVRGNPVAGTILVTFDPHRLSLPALLDALAGRGPVLREVAAAREMRPLPSVIPPTRRGLSQGEALRLQQQFGPNILPDRPMEPFWRRFISQFTDLSSVILLAGTGLAALTGRVWEVVAVGAAAGLSALIGAWREGREDQALAALRTLTPPHATVVRDGQVSVIPAARVVPGDLLMLETGDRIPADVMVTEAIDLEVDDGNLLGNDDPGPRPALANHLLPAGSEIRRGHGEAIVVATGAATTLGRVARTLGHAARAPSPVERRTVRLARDLTKVALLSLAVVVGSGLLRGVPPMQLLQSGVSLAAATVPEGLLAYITLALAAGARRIARRGAYVRELATAEGVGAVDVICTDKTGTLTRGEMTVRTIYAGGNWWSVTGSGFEASGQFMKGGQPAAPLDDPDLRTFLDVAVRCNNATLVEEPNGTVTVRGSQTEGALLVTALKAGLRNEFGREPRLGEESFDPARRRMSLTVGIAGAPFTCTKGAPEAVLPLCTLVLVGGETRPLDDALRADIQAAVDSMTAGGHRVLALAYAYGETGGKNLSFAGLAGIVDPPRRELRPVITRIRRAGIRTIVLTGDHPETAAAVARDLGLLHARDEIVTGAELKGMDNVQLSRVVHRATVFARVTPEQKSRVIQALQRRGHTVAYVGDGIDDAPAVRTANIGVAPRDRAADVTLEAAGLILTDDRFETLVSAVEQGRNTARNTDDITRYLLTGNTAEILLLLGCAVLGMPLALLPLQLLWLNVIGDGPAALALGERHSPPSRQLGQGRSQVASLERDILLQGLTMGAAVFGLYATALAGGETLGAARTMALSVLAAGQIFSLFRCRTDLNTPCGVQFPSETGVSLAMAASGLLLLATMYFPPLATALGTTPLTVGQWLAVLGTALAANLSTVASFSLRRAKPLPVQV